MRIQTWLLIAILVPLLGNSLLLCLSATAASQETPGPAARAETRCHIPGMQCTEAPWSAERQHLRVRLGMIGLPALPEEGTAFHIHEHLDIFIRGKSVFVPEGIGIDAYERFIAPLHTHDDSGIIHVESPIREPFTLGQFFDVWGVRLTDTCVGSYCAHDSLALRAFINGRVAMGDPRDIVLAPHQEIVIAYGRSDELPHPIPSHYAFPPD